MALSSVQVEIFMAQSIVQSIQLYVEAMYTCIMNLNRNTYNVQSIESEADELKYEGNRELVTD